MRNRIKKLKAVDLGSLDLVNGGCGACEIDAEERLITARLNEAESRRISQVGTGFGHDYEARYFAAMGRDFNEDYEADDGYAVG